MGWTDAVGGKGRFDFPILALTDAGCDFAVLRALRARLLAGEAVERLLTQMLGLFVEQGLRHGSTAPGCDTYRGGRALGVAPLVSM